MSKNRRKSRIFRLGLRVALYTSAASAVVIFLLLWLVSEIELTTAATTSVIALVGTFLVSYGVIFSLEFRRIQVLEQVSKNISKKRFEEIEDVRTLYDDELDYIIKHLIKSSRTVEREIQRLNRIENYRKEFIGDISHELKTPIFAIQGFIETLLNGALEDEEVNRSFLQKAMRNVNRLIYLTKDLMEISKLETGELKSEVEDIYLYEVVQETVESLNYKADKEEVSLTVIDFDKNLQVRVDKNQIRQVLINLIENGIKYNSKGGNVEIGLKDLSKEPSKVRLYVTDTGMGIDQADLPRVTERFFRVDKSRSRERGGTGLGLAIVKHIIEAHGEQLKIKSEPNRGSTFSFTLTLVNVPEILE
ncbi:MAG: hypothetical protein ED557_10110 [Balneola sp.]|nr:MAG: hypothetical protein ED557_10110 [Balneola sp.]